MNAKESRNLRIIGSVCVVAPAILLLISVFRDNAQVGVLLPLSALLLIIGLAMVKASKKPTGEN